MDTNRLGDVVTGLGGEGRRRDVVDHLREGQRLGGGAAGGADALLDQRHGEALVRDAVRRRAVVLRLARRQVEVDAQQNVLLRTFPQKRFLFALSSVSADVQTSG